MSVTSTLAPRGADVNHWRIRQTVNGSASATFDVVLSNLFTFGNDGLNEVVIGSQVSSTNGTAAGVYAGPVERSSR